MNLKSLIFKTILIKVLIIFCCVSSLRAQEKVVITTDRDYYIVGEDIWFSLGVVKLDNNKASNLSDVVYVELLNKEHIPIVKRKYCLKNSGLQSRFQLSDSLSTGNYYLRTYTRWMRNRDVRLYGTKALAILNPFLPNNMPKGDENCLKDTVRYYTEGKSLFPDIRNKILVSVSNKKDTSKVNRGTIQNTSGHVVCKFEADSSGYCIVDFIPEENQEYILTIKNKKILLPNVSTENCFIQFKEDSESFIFKVLGNCDDEMELDILSKDGQLIHNCKIPLSKSIKLRKSTMPNTLMYALLVDKSKDIYSYRVFSNSIQKKKIQVGLNRFTYGTRKQVVVKIDSLSSIRNISVSVVKNCLLKNELVVQNRISDNEKLLMLPKPSFLLNGGINKIILPEIEGELVTGKIINYDSNKPLINKEFMVNYISSNPSLEFVKTDSLGNFKFVVNRYTDEEMVIQPKMIDSVSLNYKVVLDDNYSTDYLNNTIGNLVLDTLKMRGINDAFINMQINAIYGNFKTKFKQVAPQVASYPFYHEANYVVNIDKYIELPSMEEVIREIAPATHLVKNKNGFDLKVFEDHSLHPKSAATMVFIDGLRVCDIKSLLNVKPQDLERIEVVNLQFFLKDENLGYLLCFYTKHGNMADLEFDNRIFRQVHKGYNHEYKFKSPDYSNPQLKESRLADFRNVLYFDTLEGSKNGESVDFSFYTSDDQSEYTIVVKGIDENGNWVTGRANFEVTN